jgi:hypothetical protein
MEERQTKITEGAGLEESRLNKEFIDFLQRWSTPVLLVIALIAVGYIGYQRLQQARIDKVNNAFVELEAALSTTNPNPRVLEDVAASFSSTRAVPHIASLAAADEYLRAARVGIAPGAQLRPDGTVEPSDLLSDEQRTRYLAEAERLYTGVLNATHAQHGMAIHAISAAYGLAAVAESQSPPQLDVARGHYERIIAIAERAAYDQHARNARQRIETLADHVPIERPRLYAAAELPAPPVNPNAPMMPGNQMFELPPGVDLESLFPPQAEPTGEPEQPGAEPTPQPGELPPPLPPAPEPSPEPGAPGPG